MSVTKVQSIEPVIGKSIITESVMSSTIDEIFEKGIVKNIYDLYPNQGVVLKNGGSQSAIGITSKCGNWITLVEKREFFGIGARNKEQKVLQHILADPEIRCVVITGAAGTGKTTILGSYALSEVLSKDKKSNKKLLLSKPLETVGRGRFLGTVPGSMEDKFSPFLISFIHMFEGVVGKNGPSYLETAMEKKIIEFMPLELMRGASFRNSIVYFDECQVLNYHEMETIGSRIDDVGNSKILLSGDLNQRDRKIKRDKTGLWKLVSSEHFLRSPHTASVHLVENERGIISQLFFDVFNEDRDN